MAIIRSVFETKDDWSKFRSGLFTASEIHRLLADPKDKTQKISQGAKTYVIERVASILAPLQPDYYSQSMQHGNETEPQAVMAFAEKHGYDINGDDFIYTSIGGFVFFHDDELGIGGTPDVITPKANAEIKCPNSDTHAEYLMVNNQKDLPKEYYAQMQLNMYLTGKKLTYFVSFDDRYYSSKHHYKEIEVVYDESFIDRIITKVKIANEYKNELLSTLK